ncbi:transposase [Nitratireductor sp. XY-223]|uniref:transposase n=1 Tax=Nitratireductor sp. XY-223 TaxID=2561926 RepID=UPI0010AA3568|nr:transposase [Nitratireductor sp. XY-223]
MKIPAVSRNRNWFRRIQLGPTPRVCQSGEIDRSGHVSNSGDRRMRYLLVEAATSTMLVSKKWRSLKAWAMKVAKRSGTTKATVALARRIAIVMHQIWITGKCFRFGNDDQSGAVTT